ncbi:AI-2E family transporter [Roseiconus nitratireducens]|uniref:AI-2E family transporter n=1 Tax=Roseiconus nitratireducens TaxID=2605748 RepID=A0A5M6D8G6_9BACT|nr:AI-2E family transporter [Roseiconus nitratireducens]KAA5542602.1 AI-2E family transporter [Roseiconus nitratireducens]
MNERTDNEPTEPATSLVSTLAVRICATMLVLYALYYARSLFVPVVTAIVLYLTLRPIVRRGRAIRIPSTVTAIAIMAGLVILLASATYLVFTPAKQTLADAPRHIATAKERLAFVFDKMEEVDQATEEMSQATDGSEEAAGEDEPVPVEIEQPAWSSNVTLVNGTGNFVSFVTVAGVLLFFLLAAGDDLLRNVMRSLPDFTSRRRMIEVLQNVQEGLGSYLAQVSLINAGLGISVTVAMWLFGMPSPFVWGTMAFAFNFIPIVGAICGAIIIFFVAIVNFDTAWYASVVTLGYIGLTSLEGQVITPAILGRSMRISPVLVFIFIVFWGWMWGMMGVFLSVPILIATRMICEGYEGLHPIALILGAEESHVLPHKDSDQDEAKSSSIQRSAAADGMESAPT